MLQHSREGSGEHRVVDINALVEESLNLAWHGARAETPGFEIKLKQSFDPSAGGAESQTASMRRPGAGRRLMVATTNPLSWPRPKTMAIVWKSESTTTAPA